MSNKACYQSESGFPRRIGTLLLGLTCSVAACSVRAAEETDKLEADDSRAVQLANSYVQEFARWKKLEAQKELADRDRAQVSTDRRALGAFPGYEALPAPTKKTLTNVLLKNVEPVVRGLEGFAKTQEPDIDALCKEWIVVRAARNQTEIENAEVIANKRAAGKIATLVGLDNRWFWLFGVIAVAALCTVAWHDRRHELRRLTNGAKARAMGIPKLLVSLLLLLIILTFVIFLFGGTIYRYLTDVGEEVGSRSASSIERETEQVVKNQELLKKELEKIGPAAGDSKSFPAPAGAEPSVEAKQLNQQWTHASDHLRQIQWAFLVKEKVAAEMLADGEKLAKLRQEHGQHVDEIAKFKAFKLWIRSGIGLGLIGLSMGSALLFVRGINRRNKQIAKTCPMCLGEDTLELEANDGGHSGVEMLKCTNVLSQDPYEECDFKFLSIYRDMPKLCFPTLGHPLSGKTFWLAMTYRELNNRNYEAKVQFERVRNEGAEDFDRIVEEIVKSGMDPGRTQSHRIPHPVLFNFGDHDRYGKSNLLVSIFDYSGEVTQGMTLHDSQRRRALDADGYLFFLDPTAPKDEQVKELINFREDVRAIRKKTRSGQVIQAPVALCVSKIDMMVRQAYADPGGEGAIKRFYDELKAVDPTGEAVTLEIIEARSRLIQELRDTIWPGWPIEKQIQDLFGGRCMFFPLTPVGLNDLGERDLRKRLIEPFAILEPLMWLLHMNGYPVMD